MHEKPFISWTYSIWYSHKTAGFDWFNKINAILGLRRSAFYPPVRKQVRIFRSAKYPLVGPQARRSAKYPRPRVSASYSIVIALRLLIYMCPDLFIPITAAAVVHLCSASRVKDSDIILDDGKRWGKNFRGSYCRFSLSVLNIQEI